LTTKSTLPIWIKLCVFLITWLVFLFVFQVVGFYSVPPSFYYYDDTSLYFLTIDRLFQLFATLTAIWIFTKYIDKTPFIALGFYVKKRIPDILLGIFLGAIVMTIGCFSLSYLKEITIQKNASIDVNQIMLSILFYISIAVLEEVLCRGYLLRQLLKICHKYLALLSISLFFTVLHSLSVSISVVSFINLFLLGVLFGVSYIHTKNLWFPIALHFSWNFFQYSIFGFGVNGFRSYSILEQTRIEDTIMNGGKFGFDASLLATAILLIMIFCIDWYYSKKSIL
jgi:membrane protease YdiL (CAAX protease family)